VLGRACPQGLVVIAEREQDVSLAGARRSRAPNEMSPVVGQPSVEILGTQSR
jgi:hypothetical protein